MNNVKTDNITDEICNKLNKVLATLQKDNAKISLQEDKFDKWDGKLLFLNGFRFVYLCKNITRLALAKIAYSLKEANVILLAEYITPQMCEWLIAEGIEFIDTAGNMYIKDENHSIIVKNCEKPKVIEQKNIKGRAWTLVGLKVLFLLLTENDALNWTYRKIAEYSGVSLGAIRYILADLENQNFIIKLDGKYEWLDKNKIIEQWVNLYQLKILPKLDNKKYLGKMPLDIDKYPLLVSGETFCNKENIIKSNKTLFYAYGNINECIARSRWKESVEGDIEIRETFWPTVRNMQKEVPYLLIYADLIAENDSRCTDAALEIYHRYLEV